MAQTSTKPNFLWQAMLILVPVLVLLLVGLGLRQDTVQAHREAGERAQHLANELLQASALTLAAAPQQSQAAVSSPMLQVDAAGRLLSPPANGRLVPKPLLVDMLNAEQSRYWRSARSSEAQAGATAAALDAYKQFLALHPAPEFAANALYSLGLLHALRGDSADAATQFTTLIQQYPAAVSESGLPLAQLARLKLLDMQTNLPPPERLTVLGTFCSNLVYSPNPLSLTLLNHAANAAPDSATRESLEPWMRLWRQHELVRALYAAVGSHLTNETAFWFSFDDGMKPSSNAGDSRSIESNRTGKSWLAVRCGQAPAGNWFRCWSDTNAATELGKTVSRIFSDSDYFGAEVRVDGKTIVPLAHSAASPELRARAPELLGVARGPGSSSEWLEASVYLTQPALLYLHQRTRRLWFGSLIGISAVAALLGLFASWRAFQRQLRLSELKSNFVSSVSHELRTPVAAVQLLVEGLETGKVSGPWKQSEYLRLIRQECRRLSALIENVLDFSRIERGRKEFKFEPTNLAELVEQTVKVIEPYAAERKVSLAVSLPVPGPQEARPVASLDRSSIEQALLNLLDNAIKHSPEGQTVRIGLGTENGAARSEMETPPGSAALGNAHAPARLIRLWVEDQGEGIPADEHEKIFERFYRRGSELRRETQGVGIGLSIVKHVAEGHGGRVLVRSAPGQGSRFTLELPMNLPPDTSHELK